MRSILVAGGLAMMLAMSVSPAHAIGCISGGAVGALAGHQVHHGVVGAVGGCVAGHYAHKRAVRQQQMQMQQSGSTGYVPPGTITQ